MILKIQNAVEKYVLEIFKISEILKWVRDPRTPYFVLSGRAYVHIDKPTYIFDIFSSTWDEIEEKWFRKTKKIVRRGRSDLGT